MEHRHRKPLHTIDGFLPAQRSRHVGFSSRAKSNKITPTTGPRRPGFHTQTSINESRKSLSDFSSRPITNFQLGDTKEPSSQLGNKQGQNNLHDAAISRPKGKFVRLRSIHWKRLFKRTAIAFAVLVLLSGSWMGWKIIHNSARVFGSGSNLLGFFSSTKLKGEDQGRVNVLLAGVSTDDPGHDGANLTDSIMLVSLDTKNNNATLLSIPRDLWVNIPGYGFSKINAANVYGDSSKFSEAGYPSGGIGLLEKVIHDNLQINIDYYAKIDYTAFRDAVNAVGGIQVSIKSPDPRGLYDPNINKTDHGPLRLSNGLNNLDGQTALNLARARGDSYYSYGFPASDFDRTEHQRQMLIALKEKVSSTGVLANPIKLGQLFDALGQNIQTDVKTSEVRRAYDLSKKVGSNNIQSVSFNSANGINLLTNYRSYDGQSALVPAAGINDFSQMQLFLKKLFSDNPVTKESANVVVLNGGNTTGLAAKEKTFLVSKDINVVSVASAPTTTQTIIIDQSNSKMPNTKQTLIGLFGNNISNSNTYGYPTADFIVVLGTNQKAPS